jgi:multisubunit Na+/H+ antiporter MnhB subunit
LIIVFYLVNIILPKGSWTNLIISAIILGIIGLIINILILLNKKERAFLLSKISNKIHIKKFRKK